MTQLTALTSPATTIQTWSANTKYAKVAGIGPGGNGGVPQTGPIGGASGGAGSYSARNLVSVPSTAYYYLPGSGTANDAWFNDLNLLTQSNAFSNAVWGLSGGTLTSAATMAPDGTNTGWLLQEDTTANGTHYVSQLTPLRTSVSAPIIFSVYLKPYSSERDVHFQLLDTSFADIAGVAFDLVNFRTYNASATGTSSVVSSAITAAPNGWYRASIAVNWTSADTQTYCKLLLYNPALGDVYTGTGVNGAYIWGANANYGSILKPYTPTTTSAVYSIVSKAGTNATASAAGAGQSGGVGDVVNQGGNGFLPASGAIGAAGPGAAGPYGPGSSATSSTTGGSADNGALPGGGPGAAGKNGTEFANGAGSGAGAQTTGASNGLAGGNYGGGGGGSGSTGTTGGSGGGALIVVIPQTYFRKGRIVPTLLGQQRRRTLNRY